MAGAPIQSNAFKLYMAAVWKSVHNVRHVMLSASVATSKEIF